MKFYVVFGLLAALALHALADETNPPTTTAAAADRTSVATKTTPSDGSSTLLFYNKYL